MLGSLRFTLKQPCMEMAGTNRPIPQRILLFAGIDGHSAGS